MQVLTGKDRQIAFFFHTMQKREKPTEIVIRNLSATSSEFCKIINFWYCSIIRIYFYWNKQHLNTVTPRNEYKTLQISSSECEFQYKTVNTVNKSLNGDTTSSGLVLFKLLGTTCRVIDTEINK
jgi:hypothetical protein